MMPTDLIAAVFASVAAAFDVKCRRIPNWLTFTGLAGGLVLQIGSTGTDGITYAFGGAILGLLMLLPFYVIHAIGAGDVKLLAGIGALVGPQVLVSVAIYGALVGGLISVIVLVQKRRLLFSLGEMLTRPAEVRFSGAKAPYGVAIASGMYLSMVLPRVIG